MKIPEFTIDENLRGFDLRFKTTYGIFSYKKLDLGTKLLIEYLQVKKTDTCLDLGCGYGPIGIVMAKLAPDGKTYLVDRDFVAIEYAKNNLSLNGATNGKTLLSNGFSRIDNIKFDIIASHLPTHISNEMLSWMIKDARSYLKKNGRLYVVTVSQLKPFIKKEFISIFGNYKKVKQNRLYAVSLAVK